MGLIDLAKTDWRRITTNKDRGFGVDITFKTPDLLTTLAVVGLGTNHSLSIDNDGNPVQSKNAHVTISEALFSDASYPVRNTSADEVDLLGHFVSYPDSTGVIKDYVVIQQFPDETVGVITCILSDFEQIGYDPLIDDDLVMYYDFSGLVLNADNVFGTVDSGGLISNWKNLKSDVTFDLIQNTTTAKPSLDIAGIITDGVNDFLATLNLPTEIKTGGDFTFVVVGESITNTSGSNSVIFQGTNHNYITNQVTSLGKAVFFSRNSSASPESIVNDNIISVGNDYVNLMNYKPNWELFSNGLSAVTGTFPKTKAPLPSVLEIGRFTGDNPIYLPGKIKAVYVWKTEVTDVQKIAEINTFLNDKWL